MARKNAAKNATPKQNSPESVKSKFRWEPHGVLIEDAMALRVAPPKNPNSNKPPGGKPA